MDEYFKQKLIKRIKFWWTPNLSNYATKYDLYIEKRIFDMTCGYLYVLDGLIRIFSFGFLAPAFSLWYAEWKIMKTLKESKRRRRIPIWKKMKLGYNYENNSNEQRHNST